MRLTQVTTRRPRLGLGLLLAGVVATSGLVQAGDRERENMPGSELPLEEAVERADLIVVAKLLQLTKVASVGALTSSRVKLETVEDLKGAAATADMDSISLGFSGYECPLINSETYVFFISHYKERPFILKALSETQENIAAIKSRTR